MYAFMCTETLAGSKCAFRETWHCVDCFTSVCLQWMASCLHIGSFAHWIGVLFAHCGMASCSSQLGLLGGRSGQHRNTIPWTASRRCKVFESCLHMFIDNYHVNVDHRHGWSRPVQDCINNQVRKVERLHRVDIANIIYYNLWSLFIIVIQKKNWIEHMTNKRYDGSSLTRGWIWKNGGGGRITPST